MYERLLTMRDIINGVKDCERREFCFLTKDIKEGFLNTKSKEEDEFEPTTFQEAWNHPSEKAKMKWREAIRKEFRAQINKGVYRKIRRRDVPPNKRCIKCKWVFKRKSNGIYRARLVTCGCGQISNVDFTESFNPVCPLLND